MSSKAKKLSVRNRWKNSPKLLDLKITVLSKMQTAEKLKHKTYQKLDDRL
ncbi:hypothetical protein Y021_07950 [Streptococcus thermophilus 1F8CT]|nr:hypothetical protein Y021_07950 [Streptococcus thermophilus 1F8CT]